MRNIGPFGLENRIFAGLCGLGALLVALVIFGSGFFGSLVFGIIVGIIVLLWLLMRANEETAAGANLGDVTTGTGTPASATPATRMNVSDNVGSDTGAVAIDPQITTDAAMRNEEANAVEAVDPQITTDAAMKDEEANAVTAVDPQVASDAGGAKVKASTQLPGQDDLASRKGEWKYEGGGAAADKAPVVDEKLDTPAKVAKASAEMTGGAGDKDYDGDGVIEGENEGSKPEMLTGARDGGADNLKEIKGVGPKMEKMLNEMGVYHFDQVAGWSAQEVAWVDANLKGFKGRVSRDGWVEQAKILAAGGDTEFSKKVEKGGVY